MTDRDRTSISLRIEADIDMDPADLWPDGSVPDPITAADVVALIDRCRTRTRFLDEWNLTADLDVSVTVSRPNPHHGQPPMFGPDTSGQAWLHDTATAFDGRPQTFSAPARAVVDTKAL